MARVLFQPLGPRFIFFVFAAIITMLYRGDRFSQSIRLGDRSILNCAENNYSNDVTGETNNIRRTKGYLRRDEKRLEEIGSRFLFAIIYRFVKMFEYGKFVCTCYVKYLKFIYR